MMLRRILSALFAMLILFPLLCALTLTASAAAEELTVKWNYGYVGSSTNGSNNVNKLASQSASSTYRYSDVITIEKAGTKITFTDSVSNFASTNAYVISSWIKSGSDWALDLSYANYPGASAATKDVQTYNSATGVTYTYITSRDNENIRLCYCCTGNKDAAGNDIYPKVYTEFVGGKGTYDAGNPVVVPDGTALEVKWDDNKYVGSEFDPNGNRLAVGSMSGYILSDVITVAKAGTKLTWNDRSIFPAYYVLTVSSWKKNASGMWELDADGARYRSAGGAYTSRTETPTSAGVTYSYTTTKDNENIRICYNKNGNTAYPGVYMKESAGAGSWAATTASAYKDNTVPMSAVTGVRLAGKVMDVNWNLGYVGSSINTSYANRIANNGCTYLYSDVLTIAKAGSTVCFFDGKLEDFDSGIHASYNANAISSWKLVNGAWVTDTQGVSINASATDTVMTAAYKMYSYTTSKDNENIRLCYRAGYKDASGPLEIYNVYLIEPTDFAMTDKAGELTAASYTDESGKRVEYSIYLPEGYTADGHYKLAVVADNDTSKLEMLKQTGAVIAFCTAENAAGLTDKLARNACIRKDSMFIIGGAATVGEYPSLYAASADTISTAQEAAALLASSPDYYSCLEGITTYAMGDSYFDGAGIGHKLTWPGLLADKYGMSHINYGIGGSTVSNFVTNKNPMVTRARTMEKGKPDILFLEGGRNDRSMMVPFGTVTGKDTKTYLGALNSIITYWREKYPDALIICITPWNYRDSTGATGGYFGTTEQYAKKMVELVEYLNDDHIKVINMADTAVSGVDMNDVRFRLKYSITSNDISHLNADGQKLVLGKIEKKIAELYAAYRNIDMGGTPETTPPETDAPSPDTTPTTDTPVVTDTPADVTTAPEGKGGCGSAATASLALILLPAVSFIMIKGKKENR